MDEALGVFSLVRDVQTGRASSFDDTMSELKQRLDRFTPSMLVSQTVQQDFPKESETFTLYLSSLRDAIAGAESGNSTYAEWVLQKGASQNFAMSLETLGRFWNCQEVDDLNPTEGVSSTDKALFKNGASESKENKRVAPDAPVPGRSNVRSVMQNSGHLRPAKIERRENLQVDVLLLFAMAISAVLGMFYVLKKRPKPRETRRIIHKSTVVRLGQSKHDMTIVDITANGCKLEHVDHVDRQKTLQVYLDGHWYPGHIKWHNTAYIGVRFHRPMNQKTFNKIVEG